MPTPSLSFVMPIYKPDYILFDKVLKALTVQSLKSWEIVFVLDGPDEAAEAAILRVMKKCPNEFKILNLEHGGVQKARNAGTAASKGKYVVCFDSDCIIQVHAAQAWVDMLDQNQDIGFVYSGYDFCNEMGAIASEPFDPWTLKIRNYISACFPVRRELAPKWDESLLSLQDWSFWLSVVAAGGKGMFLQGSAFTTAYPTPKSISGQGCTPEVWLSRMDAVRAIHGLPKREVCVTSVNDRLDGIALAKAIDADYLDYPNDKPNYYRKIIQIGFSVRGKEFERCASAWGKQHEKIIFWTADDVEALQDCSIRALKRYAPNINQLGKQYVEDKKAKALMTEAGFTVEVLPLPVISTEEVDPLPESPKFLVDVGLNYGHAFNAIKASIPDIQMVPIGGAQDLSKYTGLISFRQDRLLSPAVKRVLAAGRHVVSNIQAPFTGFLEDNTTDGAFIREFVNKIRSVAKAPQSKEAVRYWINPQRIARVKEALA